jgi:hypothetical protein
MEKDELKNAIVNLLYDLHSKNLLNLYIINSISQNFQIDAIDLCDNAGITYFID